MTVPVVDIRFPPYWAPLVSKLFPLLCLGAKDASLLWNTFLVSAEDFSVKKKTVLRNDPAKSGWDNRFLGWILQEDRGCECAHPPADRKSLLLVCVRMGSQGSPVKSYDYLLKFLLVGDSDVGKGEILDSLQDGSAESPYAYSSGESLWSQLTQSCWINSLLVAMIFVRKGHACGC